mmetsp:Transcript_51707/g.123075  ORF Transcript_51707/g.123075 Transcript_51707/m.123075 type:complete len:164 (+) Transcript_51707:243-734(+)
MVSQASSKQHSLCGRMPLALPVLVSHAAASEATQAGQEAASVWTTTLPDFALPRHSRLRIIVIGSQSSCSCHYQPLPLPLPLPPPQSPLPLPLPGGPGQSGGQEGPQQGRQHEGPHCGPHGGGGGGGGGPIQAPIFNASSQRLATTVCTTTAAYSSLTALSGA